MNRNRPWLHCHQAELNPRQNPVSRTEAEPRFQLQNRFEPQTARSSSIHSALGRIPRRQCACTISMSPHTTTCTAVASALSVSTRQRFNSSTFLRPCRIPLVLLSTFRPYFHAANLPQARKLADSLIRSLESRRLAETVTPFVGSLLCIQTRLNDIIGDSFSDCCDPERFRAPRIIPTIGPESINSFATSLADYSPSACAYYGLLNIGSYIRFFNISLLTSESRELFYRLEASYLRRSTVASLSSLSTYSYCSYRLIGSAMY